MSIVATHPMKISGAWRQGYVLDYHTLSSDFIGHDEFGNPRFDTKRPEVGELLYQLKYMRNTDALKALVGVAVSFVRKWSPNVDAIIPVPATRVRRPQPVVELAIGLGKSLNLPVLDGFVRNVKNTKELKNVFDYDERIKLLKDAYKVRDQSLSGKSVLLFDDLYRSGATLNAVTKILYDQGQCSTVYALALTRTRTAS
jgi:predicted amidophosphoribosyltransferase